jgi:DnaJ-class molecular chaperone
MFEVEGAIVLADIKKTYRELVKEWHPDKFQSDDEKAKEAEEVSRQIIEAYHFLVSIAPETKEKNLDEYNALIASSTITEYQHKGKVLEVTFSDGNTYEYFGVPEKVYAKMNSAPTLFRFAKRNIFNSYLYRKLNKKTVLV